MVRRGVASEILPTGKRIDELLPKVLGEIHETHRMRPDLVLIFWPEVLGGRFAALTKAISFQDGILTVRVSNSTLLSLLSQHEKPRLLKKLRERFPQFAFRNICFRMGKV
ncbi:MAG TPA: DUF721 domain-containing protein [Parachlamydiales bacterium]|nr:MAG: hypothetical protein A2098_04715 [Chlamydiae bacterium GWF2_49_8]OGN57173.1 MAG: hypothetical protein A3D18_05690 [Chlamydiae bacterium RIFCSPHIGHO2_02_FULL_49_29]OGN62640.1 MAG: hypothetical protein A3E26_04210 [Chlamydiae bacterium RIFCSPHIGHO2_12_FULL_49_32]OGN70865.1 MAG: hypothetical protein A3I15_06535 [Chlamydiae bacterium RIFCSPLOWO2_02_FULL_49_12]OGN71329.1 MAG: hypothetical protein A3G30_03175 [Chlamydiae bacterium RIFCSPLOWO2_12_FULL_49_12]HAZ15321.1 DUF721 domain-containing